MSSAIRGGGGGWGDGNDDGDGNGGIAGGCDIEVVVD